MNLQDGYKNTALHAACWDDQTKTVEFLFDYLKDKGTNFNKQNGEGETPFHKACMSGIIGIVRIFLDYATKEYIDVNAIGQVSHFLTF